MIIIQILEDIGLSEGESKVYLGLLKLGTVKVAQIKEETGLHRTTIYDFLEKLLNKGLANYVIENNVKFYSATHPNKLIDYVKEKEDKVKHIMPDLMELVEFQQDEVKVEVYRGKEGYKTIANDMLRLGQDYVIFGIDDVLFVEKIGSFMDWLFEKEQQKGMHERVLTKDSAEFTYDIPNATYRYLPDESFNPTPTFVWGDNVAIMIWEPFTVIRIQHKEIADSYLKHFNILWEMASETPRNR